MRAGEAAGKSRKADPSRAEAARDDKGNALHAGLKARSTRTALQYPNGRSTRTAAVPERPQYPNGRSTRTAAVPKRPHYPNPALPEARTTRSPNYPILFSIFPLTRKPCAFKSHPRGERNFASGGSESPTYVRVRAFTVIAPTHHSSASSTCSRNDGLVKIFRNCAPSVSRAASSVSIA